MMLRLKFSANKAFKRNKNSGLRFASLHILTHYFCPLNAALSGSNMLSHKEINSLYCVLCGIHNRRISAYMNGNDAEYERSQKEYFGLLEYMISVGWDDRLPLDMEPDDEHLPQAYLKLREEIELEHGTLEWPKK